MKAVVLTFLLLLNSVLDAGAAARQQAADSLGGTVGGRVSADSGRPLPGVEVSLLRRVYQPNGWFTLEVAARAQTDERGDFLISGMQEGRYYLRAGAISTRIPGTPPERYPPVFYPGSPDAESALPVDVRSGTESSGLDFVRRAENTYRVRGRIVEASSGQPPAAPGVYLSVVPRGPRRVAAPPDAFAPYQADGTFDLADVFPGSYWLVATERVPVPAPATPAQQSLTGRTAAASLPPPRALAPLDVMDRDVEGVSVALNPDPPLAGRIFVEDGELQPVEAAAIAIEVMPVLWGDTRFGAPLAGAVVQTDGRFLFPAAPSGEYVLSVAMLPRDFYVKEARYGRQDALGSSIQIGPSGDSLNIVLGARGGQVDGVVRSSAGDGVPNAAVVLVPDRGERHLFKTTTSDSRGRFTIRGAAPGEYKLLAWESVEGFSFFAPEIVAAAADFATPVRVEASRTIADVQMVPK